MSAAPPALDRRLRPTPGVAMLFGAALVDAALLPLRLAIAFASARRRKREIAALLERTSVKSRADAA